MLDEKKASAEFTKEQLDALGTAAALGHALVQSNESSATTLLICLKLIGSEALFEAGMILRKAAQATFPEAEYK